MRTVKNAKSFDSVQHSNDHITVPKDVPDEYLFIWLAFAHQLGDKYRYYKECDLSSVTVTPLWLIFTGVIRWQGYVKTEALPMMVHYDRVRKVYQLFTWVNMKFEPNLSGQ